MFSVVCSSIQYKFNFLCFNVAYKYILIKSRLKISIDMFKFLDQTEVLNLVIMREDFTYSPKIPVPSIVAIIEKPRIKKSLGR